jgi:hypothetical protein
LGSITQAPKWTFLLAFVAIQVMEGGETSPTFTDSRFDTTSPDSIREG